MRMRSTLVAKVAALMGGLAACGEPSAPITELPRELTVAEQLLVQSDNRFAFKLFREINDQDTTGGNVFLSPLSVAMALGMTYNGAGGETRAAMGRTLELEGLSLADINQSYRTLIDLLRGLDESVEFILANSIWYRDGITVLPEFLNITKEFFDAEVAALDFSDPRAADRINAWVSEQTRGRITEIVPKPIPPDVLMHLLNAMYFKGAWTNQFDPKLTRPAPFYLAPGSELSVPMMSHRGLWPMRYAADEWVQVVDLPYGRGAYVMTLLLPQPTQNIDSLMQRLTQDAWDRWIASLDSTTGTIVMPKFTLEYQLLMNDVLKALGMGIAFAEGGPADFSPMFGPGSDAYISEVRHKTFVEVNEEGTEAAAATDVVIVGSHGGPHLYVNQPFLFVIRERWSGTILFMGKLLNPAS